MLICAGVCLVSLSCSGLVSPVRLGPFSEEARLRAAARSSRWRAKHSNKNSPCADIWDETEELLPQQLAGRHRHTPADTGRHQRHRKAALVNRGRIPGRRDMSGSVLIASAAVQDKQSSSRPQP